MSKIQSLYIHIPFCDRICTYCDFYKMVAKEDVKDKYVDYLIKELELKKQYFGFLKTIFIGGGTPTALSISSFTKLLEYLKQNINLNNVTEFTVEANPNNINIDYAKLFSKYGVNRISLGVQSLNPEKLNVLGRTHLEIDVKNSIKILRKEKITNISADIIYGVSGDSWELIKYDLNNLIKFGVTHISAYSLILEERTILMKLLKEGKYSPYNEDLERELFVNINKYLKSKRFNHYEISNYAKKNCESIHNLTYWNNMNYIGVGASASYYIDNIRYTNIKNLNKYYQGIDENNLNYAEFVELTKKDMMSEELIMGLRKISGININNFQDKYFQSIYDAFPIINSLFKMRLLEIKNNHLFIPEDKLYLSNEVLVNFI